MNLKYNIVKKISVKRYLVYLGMCTFCTCLPIFQPKKLAVMKLQMMKLPKTLMLILSRWKRGGRGTSFAYIFSKCFLKTFAIFIIYVTSQLSTKI